MHAKKKTRGNGEKKENIKSKRIKSIMELREWNVKFIGKLSQTKQNQTKLYDSCLAVNQIAFAYMKFKIQIAIKLLQFDLIWLNIINLDRITRCYYSCLFVGWFSLLKRMDSKFLATVKTIQIA